MDGGVKTERAPASPKIAETFLKMSILIYTDFLNLVFK